MKDLLPILGILGILGIILGANISYNPPNDEAVGTGGDLNNLNNEKSTFEEVWLTGREQCIKSSLSNSYLKSFEGNSESLKRAISEVEAFCHPFGNIKLKWEKQCDLYHYTETCLYFRK